MINELTTVIAFLSCFCLSVKAQLPKLTSPQQDQGLPYTRSARPRALEAIKGTTALFIGGRYAYINGYKVRLDTKDILHSEAVLQNGKLFVPGPFASLITQKEFNPKPIPKDLTSIADKWVYEADRHEVKLPPSVQQIKVDGKNYFSAADLAKSAGKEVFQTKRGLLLISNTTILYKDRDKVLDDCVITLFDTPEKLADPDIATEYIPTLKRQGKWTDYIKVTPEQMAILNGKETEWPFTEKQSFDYSGINTSLFGSKLPKPGVYPRVLFSPEDVPEIAARIKHSKLGQMSWLKTEYLLEKSWFDPSTSDGKLFVKLATGDTANLTWPVTDGMWINEYSNNFKDEQPGIFNTHVGYVPECLVSIALYCLLNNDNKHGQMVAHAISNYYLLREQLLDSLDKMSDSQLGSEDFADAGVCSETNTRSTGGPITVNRSNLKSSVNKPPVNDHQFRSGGGLLPHMNLGLSLDFAGKWMSDKEKDNMRRIIVKATYGKRAYGQDGPKRFRDVNWMAWDLPLFLAVSAIEGLDGFDKEVYESNVETIKSFCEWGLDKDGVVYESNGKTPGGFQFLFLSMMSLARRGDNMFGHPHLRKFLTSQIMMTSPSGKVVVNSGTQYVPFSRQIVSLQFVSELKAIYPTDKAADLILSQSRINYAFTKDDYYRQWILDDFNPKTFIEHLPNKERLRLPSIMYPGFTTGFLYDCDYQSVSKSDLNLPLQFDAPIHGVFSAFSDASPDATWINMMVRPDHYLGAGHHHADAGMFHFSSLGIDWFTESPFGQEYAGRYHNEVLVDGNSEPDGIKGVNLGYQAAATYLGANANKMGGFASADLTQTYTYRWQTQPQQTIIEEAKKMNWEMEPSDRILKLFAGTARYKFRPWWPTYNYSNYMATSRCLYNKMEYVYRSFGLVRGKHPYGVVLDDLKKDENIHLYQWTAMLNGGVWQADIKGLGENQFVLGYNESYEKASGLKQLITPSKGDPLLLVCSVNTNQKVANGMPFIQVSTEVGPTIVNQSKITYYDRLTVNTQGDKANYHMLLIPFKYGDELPAISSVGNQTTIQWEDGQTDKLIFVTDVTSRTKVVVMREGKEVVESK